MESERDEVPANTAGRGPHRLVTATTHVLESFTSAIPPYAILSQTWGAEEVTLWDWEVGRKEDSEGYRKVLGTCERALHDGIDYVWVDTSCIDKTNHVELSEAINSMFAYYRDAEVCYVLLSDVAVKPKEQRDAAQDTTDDYMNEMKDYLHEMSPDEVGAFVGVLPARLDASGNVSCEGRSLLSL